MKIKGCSACGEKRAIVHSEFAFHPFEWTKIHLCETCHAKNNQTKSHTD